MVKAEKPLVYIVTPTFNRKSKTERFVKLLRKVDYGNFKCIIVDDNSNDGTREMLINRFPEIFLIRGDGNLWWTGATNLGVKYALSKRADYILTINDDAVFESDFLSKLVKTAEKNKNAIIGSLLYYGHSKEKVWSIGGFMNWDIKIFGLNYELEKGSVVSKLRSPYEVEILCGNGTLVPTHIFKKIGLYNERWCPQVHADSEFTLRAKKSGFRILVELNSIIYNDIKKHPDVNNFYDIFFSKKSDYYWKPVFYVTLLYAPGKYKLLTLYRRYFHFFNNKNKYKLIIYLVKNLIKNFFKSITNLRYR